MVKKRIDLKTKAEIEIMREGGKILAHILLLMSEKVVPGASGEELEEIADREIKKYGVISSFRNYKIHKNGVPFPSSICVSINDEIVHGFPRGKIIREGDIVGLDLGIKHKGLHTDSAITVGAGKLSAVAQKLIKVTKESLSLALSEVKPGNRLGDIGYAVQSYVEKNGFSVVQDLVGHGVGRSIHESPEVPNYGSRGEGLKLYPGMTFAIEPMVNAGKHYIKVDDDQWTIRTEDGSLSAHFEHSVAVTEEGCIILTELA
ncbi:MAG: type I methionyl aminopeptidase [Candidatus Paceibacterota bacterium]|jgi:methionyl aminopeptidase